jgi:hypothetical protein
MKKVDNKAFHPYEFKEMPPFLLFFFFCGSLFDNTTKSQSQPKILVDK